MTNHCIALCHGSCINYHKIRKGFIQLSSESLGKKIKLITFSFLHWLFSKSPNSQECRSKNMTHSNFPWFNFLKLTNLIAVFDWYLEFCFLALFLLLKPVSQTCSLKLRSTQMFPNLYLLETNYPHSPAAHSTGIRYSVCDHRCNTRIMWLS